MTSSALKVRALLYSVTLIILLPLTIRWSIESLSYYTQFNIENYKLYWLVFFIVTYVLLLSVVIYIVPKVGLPFRCFPLTIKLTSKEELLRIVKYSFLLIVVVTILTSLPAIFPIRQVPFPAGNQIHARIAAESFEDVLGLALIVVAVPVLEEVVVRGIILPQLMIAFRTWTAIMISTVMWMVMHAGGWIMVFVIGLLYSYVTIRIRSLLPAILGHITANSMTAWILIMK